MAGAGQARTAAMAAASAPGTSGTSTCRPSRTTVRPPVTTSRTSAAVALNTTDSSAPAAVVPAVRGVSSDTVTRSASHPAAS